MTQIKVEPGTEHHIKYAKKRLQALQELRKSLRLPSMVKFYQPASDVLIALKSTEWEDYIKITGGTPVGYGDFANNIYTLIDSRGNPMDIGPGGVGINNFPALAKNGVVLVPRFDADIWNFTFYSKNKQIASYTNNNIHIFNQQPISYLEVNSDATRFLIKPGFTSANTSVWTPVISGTRVGDVLDVHESDFYPALEAIISFTGISFWVSNGFEPYYYTNYIQVSGPSNIISPNFNTYADPSARYALFTYNYGYAIGDNGAVPIFADRVIVLRYDSRTRLIDTIFDKSFNRTGSGEIGEKQFGFLAGAGGVHSYSTDYHGVITMYGILELESGGYKPRTIIEVGGVSIAEYAHASFFSNKYESMPREDQNNLWFIYTTRSSDTFFTSFYKYKNGVITNLYAGDNFLTAIFAITTVDPDIDYIVTQTTEPVITLHAFISGVEVASIGMGNGSTGFSTSNMWPPSLRFPEMGVFMDDTDATKVYGLPISPDEDGLYRMHTFTLTRNSDTGAYSFVTTNLSPQIDHKTYKGHPGTRNFVLYKMLQQVV